MTQKLLNTVQLNLLKRFAADQLNDLELEQVRALLKRFVNGELDDLEADHVMEILGENEQCMDMLDDLWMAHPFGQALAETTILSQETSQRIRHRVSRQIHRANAVGASVNFGVRGFGIVASGLLRPLFRRNKWSSRRSGRRNRQ